MSQLSGIISNARFDLHYLLTDESEFDSALLRQGNPVLRPRNETDDRMSRNWEQFITERGNMEIEPPKNGCFDIVFDQIKEKIFVSAESDDVDMTEDEKKSYENKYDTVNSLNSINKLKESICDFYIKKTEHSILIEERRRTFTNFCNNIKESIKFISEYKDTKDTELANLLNERIDWYYQQLGIEKLIEEEYRIKTEFVFLKKAIKQISNVSPPTVCSVCMEKQVSWYLDPCGHTICDDCKLKTSDIRNCHYCRSVRKKFNKLYL